MVPRQSTLNRLLSWLSNILQNILNFNIAHTIQIDSDSIQIRKDEILRMLGYEGNTQDPHLDEIIDDYMERASALLEPKAGFIIKKIIELERKSGILILEDAKLEIGKIIAVQLKDSESVVLFQCTIGVKVEQLYKELFAKGDSLEGYIVNLSGSEAAESVTEFLHQEIKKLARENQLNITNRFSPGYCNWNVKEQFKLFGMFPDNYCGISLTESAMMKPIKSVSGLIGIGSKVKFRGYNCSMCDDEFCIYRRKSS